jgi:hypothetical protein
VTTGPAAGGQERVPPGWFTRARRGLAGWRRTRPFWGGLLALLGAVEILLSEQAPLPVVIHLGAQGLAGYLVPVVMLLCAVLLWFNPAQRIFYSILAVLAALASLITSNLGGFLLGMLLGLVGGSLAFAWVPGTGPKPGRRRRGRRERPAGGQPAGTGPGSPGPAADGAGGSGGYRALAMVPVVLATAAWLVQPALAAGSPAPAPTQTATAAPTTAPPAVAPTPPATVPPPTAAPTPGPAVGPSPAVPPSPVPAVSSPPVRPVTPRVAAAPGVTPAAAPSTLTAGSAVLTGLSYDGVTSVPTAAGPVPMLTFRMNSLVLAGGTALTVTAGGHTLLVADSSLDFSGNVVLYTTRFSGLLLGVPVTFTPASPPPALLPPVMIFTNVQAGQPLTVAGSLVAGRLAVTSG